MEDAERANECVVFPVRLEQYLMVGSYDQVREEARGWGSEVRYGGVAVVWRVLVFSALAGFCFFCVGVLFSLSSLFSFPDSRNAGQYAYLSW